MAYRTRIDPQGPTRNLGRRGALKQSTFIQLQKNDGVLAVESAFEVFLAKLLDLANDAVHIAYQPFTLDIANQRLLSTLQELQDHRQRLRDAGMSGVFYTPDMHVRWQTSEGLMTEVIEAKDAQWIPDDAGEYAEKLRITKRLLQSHGAQFCMYEVSVKNLYCLPLSMNVNKLHALKLRRCDQTRTLSVDYMQYLRNREDFLSYLADEGTSTLGQLASHFSTSIWAAWHLLIDECVQCELADGPLSPATTLHCVNVDCHELGCGLFRSALSTLKTDVWEVAHA